MEAANGSARNRDKSKRKNLPREHRARAIDKSRQRRHMQGGMQRHDSDTQQGDGGQLDKRAQVVPWGEQQPHRHGGRGESIDGDEHSQSGGGQSKYPRERRMLGYPLASPDRQRYEDESEDG